MGRRLVVVAIDFEKAFNSVDRVASMHYKCDPRLVDVVLDLDVGDRTEVWRSGILVCEWDIGGLVAAIFRKLTSEARPKIYG